MQEALAKQGTTLEKLQAEASEEVEVGLPSSWSI